MNNTIVLETSLRPTFGSALAPAERPGAAGAERPAPICECPEYCLLDHSN